MASPTLMNVLKVWPIVQCLRRPNFLTGYFNKVSVIAKSQPDNPSTGFLHRVLSMLIPIELKSSIKSLDLSPCVYDAYISGLIFATAIRYTGAQSSALRISFNSLQLLVAQASQSVNGSRTQIINKGLSQKITHLYCKISRDFINVMGLSMMSSLVEVNNWIMAHSGDFGSSGGINVTDYPQAVGVSPAMDSDRRLGTYNILLAKDIASMKHRLIADSLLNSAPVRKSEIRDSNPHITVVKNNDESLTMIENYTSTSDYIRHQS